MPQLFSTIAVISAQQVQIFLELTVLFLQSVIKLSDANKSFGVYIMPCPIKFIVTKVHFVDQVKKVCYN